MKHLSCLILGGGEFASAIALYLWKSHIDVAMAVDASRFHLRRPICFAEAVVTGAKQICGMDGTLVSGEDLKRSENSDFNEAWRAAIRYHIQNRFLPIFLLQDLPNFIKVLSPDILIHTEKVSFEGIGIDSADLVIGLFPLLEPGTDCHLAIETRQNYWLGETYHSPPSKQSEMDFNFFKNPFSTVTSPLEGTFIAEDKNIGDKIKYNQTLGRVGSIDIYSPYTGQIWGLLHSGRMVHSGQPLALIYEGPPSDMHAYFGFNHRAVAGSVLAQVEHFIGT